MIRFAWYSVLLGLMSLTASAQEVVSPDPVVEQQQVTAPAADTQLVGQVPAQTTIAESDENRQPAVADAAPKAVEPDPQASAPAASEPNPRDQNPTASATAVPPASAKPAPKPQKQVAAKRKPKPQKHAARTRQYGHSYRAGYPGSYYYPYVWAYPSYSPYRIYAGRPYVVYRGYYPGYGY